MTTNKLKRSDEMIMEEKYADGSRKKQKISVSSGGIVVTVSSSNKCFLDDNYDDKKRVDNKILHCKLVTSNGIVRYGVPLKKLDLFLTPDHASTKQEDEKEKQYCKEVFKADDQQNSATRDLRREALKRRFAETILRAEQKKVECKIAKKTVGSRKQDDRAAVEKERKRAQEALEKLEKTRREERERERARAWEALEKMEKTVNFNENMETQREFEKLFCGSSAREYERMLLGVPLKSLGLFLKPDSIDEEEGKAREALEKLEKTRREERERERARAREALEKMERTVNFNENMETQKEMERLCGSSAWEYERVLIGLPLKSLGLFLQPDSIYEEDQVKESESVQLQVLGKDEHDEKVFSNEEKEEGEITDEEKEEGEIMDEDREEGEIMDEDFDEDFDEEIDIMN